MADSTTPQKPLRDLTRAEYQQRKREALRQIASDATAARAQRFLDQLAAAPDAAARRRVLRQHSGR